MSGSRKPTAQPHNPGSARQSTPTQASTVRDRIIGLRSVPAAELREHPKNWRRHPESQRSALRSLLQQVGRADACIAYESGDGLTLIDGHLRRDLEPDAVLPVLVLDIDEQEAQLLLATLDPLAAMALPDAEALASLLESVAVPDELLEEMQRGALRELGGQGGLDPEAIPKRRRRRVKAGQMWELGNHRLLCGDATQPKDLERLLGGDRADVLWTDPPYGVGYVGKTADALTIANDDAEGLEEMLRDAFVAADQVLRPGAALYVCHPAGPLALTFGNYFVATGWQLRQWLVWVKDRMVLGHTDYHYRHEPMLYGYKPGGRARGRGRGGWYGGNDQDSVFEIERPAASRDHPTAKPVELVRQCLQNSARLGARVLDPFAGSGSTLIASEELHHRAYLVELDPGYCDVIIERWERFTQRRAVRSDG